MILFGWIGIAIIILAIFFYAFNGKMLFSETLTNSKTLLGDARGSWNKLKNSTGTHTAKENREVIDK